MKKYEIIYADPAWSFGDRLRSSKKKDDGKMDYRELERRSCGSLPGDGRTEGCNDPDGCGYQAKTVTSEQLGDWDPNSPGRFEPNQ